MDFAEWVKNEGAQWPMSMYRDLAELCAKQHKALLEVAETGGCAGCGKPVARYDDPGPFMCACTRARECRHYTKPSLVCVACRVLRDADAFKDRYG